MQILLTHYKLFVKINRKRHFYGVFINEMKEDDINYLLQEFEKMEKGNYTPEENFLYKQTTIKKEKITEEKDKQIKDIRNNQTETQQALQTNPIVQEQQNIFQPNIIEQEKKQKNKLGLFGI